MALFLSTGPVKEKKKKKEVAVALWAKNNAQSSEYKSSINNKTQSIRVHLGRRKKREAIITERGDLPYLSPALNFFFFFLLSQDFADQK